MPNFCIMRVKKLHTDGNVIGSLSHHLRTRETENANPEELKNNFYFPGTYSQDSNGNYNYATENQNFESRKKMQNKALAIYRKNLPKKIRKNGVRAIELMMTVSPEVLKRKDFNATKYLNACSKWAQKKFGAKNLFFAGQHFDESTPHVSILLTPIDENGKLNARKFLGGREKLRELQDDFFETVGKEFGLDRGIKGSKLQHQDVQKWYQKQTETAQKFKKTVKNIEIPKKKFGQSQEEYEQEIKKNILEQLNPSIQKLADYDLTSQRYKELQELFNAKLEERAEEKATEKTEKLKQEKENLQTKLDDFLITPCRLNFTNGNHADCPKGILQGFAERAEELYEFKSLTPYGLRCTADKLEKMKIETLHDGYEQMKKEKIQDFIEWLDKPIQPKNRGYSGFSMSD